MPYTLDPLLSDARINLARHEFGHWWLSELCDFAPGDIVLGKGGGSCSIAYPMEPESFAVYYERSLLQAAAWLTRILAVIRIGNHVEVIGGQVGQELRGQDLDDMARWREAVLPVYDQQGWTRAYAASFQTLQSWYRYRQVQAVFREAAPALARQERLSRYQLLSLLEVTGAGSAPDPYFEAVLAPARRSPAPTAHQSPSPRRPGAATPSKGQRGDYSPFELESRGAYGLFKLVSKSTGGCFFVISRDAGTNRLGQLAIDTWEYDSEAEARRQFSRLA